MSHKCRRAAVKAGESVPQVEPPADAGQREASAVTAQSCILIGTIYCYY